MKMSNNKFNFNQWPHEVVSASPYGDDCYIRKSIGSFKPGFYLNEGSRVLLFSGTGRNAFTKAMRYLTQCCDFEQEEARSFLMGLMKTWENREVRTWRMAKEGA